MALAYASAPRFHLHRHQTAKGRFIGIARPLRISELTKASERSKWQRSATCALQPTSLIASAISFDADATRFIQSLAECLHTDSSSYIRGLVIADLDPATAKLAIGITGPLLSAFGFLFIVRIVMSWYPKLPVGKFPYVLAYAPTEPFLGVTRKLIPPLGGVDVTPVVWFGLVSFLSEILVGPQGLLVLLSQQM